MASKKIIFLIFFLGLIFVGLKAKVDFEKDLIWHLKENFPTKIVIFFKKTNIFYNHKIRKKIVLIQKNADEVIKTSLNNYYITKYSNPIFKKNGPKSYIEIFNDKLILITGTGILSFTDLKNFGEKKINLKIIRNNLSELTSFDYIARNPEVIVDMLIQKNNIFISYLNEVKKDCYGISLVMGTINFEKINFKKIFSPKECVNKKNEYGEFKMVQSGGALAIYDNNQILLTTGDYRFRDLAQNINSVFGKVLLINFKNKKYTPISAGHRNSQGIFYDKKNNNIFLSEHGPFGGDEINIIYNPLADIENFGWPISSYGEHYGGRIERNKKKYLKAPLNKSHIKYGFTEPSIYFERSIAPSKISIIPGEFNKKDNDQIFLASLGLDNKKGRRSLHNYSLNKDQKLELTEIIALNERIRDFFYSEKKNEIFLFLENSGSIGILRNK
jgi:hypothetical protein